MSIKNKQHKINSIIRRIKIRYINMPLLLKNISTLITRTNHFTPIPSVTHQPISEHLKYGVINLD